MNENVATFVSTLLHSSTNTHFAHWSTDSYAKHVALGDYYDEIIELVDNYAEAYMGRYEKLTKFPNTYHEPKDPVAYMKSLQSFVQEARQDLPQDSELQNIVDEIADLINSTVYKLVNLK